MSAHTHVATMTTNHGTIVLNLFGSHAPQTVENFVGLATGEKEWTHPQTGKKSTDPLYDGVVFHRIIKDFMLQGGDPLGQGTGGPGYQFDDEISRDLDFSKPYILAMANAGTQGGRGTNGSQFFITTAPPPGSRASTRSSARSPTTRPRRSSTRSTRSRPTAATVPARTS
ncbi:hypothetical protein MAFF212519_11700 [Clavibacter michiganensis]